MESDLDLGIGNKQCSSDSLVLKLVLADDKAPFKDNQAETTVKSRIEAAAFIKFSTFLMRRLFKGGLY